MSQTPEIGFYIDLLNNVQSPSRNLMSLAGSLMPVRPRQTVPNLTGDRNLNNVYLDRLVFITIYTVVCQPSSESLSA